MAEWAKGFSRTWSGLELFRRILEGVKDADTTSGKVPHIPRDENKPMNPRRSRKRQIPPVFVLARKQTGPLRHHRRINRDDAIRKRLLQRIDRGEKDCGALRIAALESLRAATLFEQRGGAQAQVGIVDGCEPAANILVAAGSCLSKDILIEKVQRHGIARGSDSSGLSSPSKTPRSAISDSVRFRLRGA